MYQECQLRCSSYFCAHVLGKALVHVSPDGWGFSLAWVELPVGILLGWRRNCQTQWGNKMTWAGNYARNSKNKSIYKFSIVKWIYFVSAVFCTGKRWRSWLRHCAASRKVAGSIPDYVTGIFHWHNPSGRTMTLALTQPLTEMSTRNISWE